MMKIKDICLKKGSHASPEAGLCIMEAVAYFAKEKHSDKPKCACPVLRKYMISLNDSFTDDERQLLKPYIKKLINTNDGKSLERAKILSWASIVKFTPHCLEIIGLNKEAEALKSVKKFDWSAESAAWLAVESAESAAKSAAWLAKSAESAAKSAWLAKSAESAAKSAKSAWLAAESAAESAAEQKIARRKVIDLALKALDEALDV